MICIDGILMISVKKTKKTDQISEESILLMKGAIQTMIWTYFHGSICLMNGVQ